MIRQASGTAEKASDPDALQEVCLNYWYPLYLWARRSGWGEEDAKDLIQGFFEQLLEKEFLQSANSQEGRLRTFLLTCLKRHAQDVTQKAQAAKRDARKTVSLDFEWAEGRYHDHPSSSDGPDQAYDRQWAHTLLRYALEALRQEAAAEGKAAEYDVLKTFLGFAADEDLSYQEAAARLGIGEAAVKSRIYRLRKRYHELVQLQAGLTLGRDVTTKEELMELMGLL